MVADLGMHIITFQPFRDFEGMPGDKRTRAFARAERKFDLMQELGCDLLLVCSNISPDSVGGIDRAAADLADCSRHGRSSFAMGSVTGITLSGAAAGNYTLAAGIDAYEPLFPVNGLPCWPSTPA